MKLSLTLLFTLSGFCCAAQKIEGSVFDKETRNALADVSLTNKRTGNTWSADKDGRFVAYGIAGDTILFYHASYSRAIVIVPFTTGNVYRTVFMDHLSYTLKEATVTSGSRFVQDSLAMRETFQHAIDYNQPVKPEFEFSGGIGVRGLFSALAERLLGQTKKKKKFLNTFAGYEQSKFVDTRYTQELVSALTNLPQDSAANFMNATPCPTTLRAPLPTSN